MQMFFDKSMHYADDSKLQLIDRFHNIITNFKKPSYATASAPDVSPNLRKLIYSYF